jgi:NADH pyrophosphatase NudC (nudix superfamily)
MWDHSIHYVAPQVETLFYPHILPFTIVIVASTKHIV